MPKQSIKQILLADTSRPMGDREVVRDSQHGFIKGKLCLTKLVAFYNRVIASVGKRKATVVNCLDFCKAFDMVPHNVLN